MLKKTSLIIVVAILIIISSAIFYQSGKSAGKSESAKQVETLQKSLETFFMPLPEKVTSATGKITKIENSIVYFESTFRVKRFPQADGSENKILIKKIKIGSGTKIVKSDFNAAPSEITPGVPEINLKSGDLKIGQQIYVSTDENMLEKDEFTAAEIRLLAEPIGI